MSSLLLKKTPTQFDCDAPPLNRDETEAAFAELNVRPKYRALERSFADPVIPDQNVALVSYLAAPENKYGVIAFAKVRGVFRSAAEASDAARRIIKRVDSVNYIHHVPVGKPFPLFLDCRGGNFEDVSLDEDYDSVQKDFARAQEVREIETKREMRKREQALIKDVDPDAPKDPVEEYITKRQKFVSVAQVYKQYEVMLNHARDVLVKTRREIREMETPQILQVYMDRYVEKMRECGAERDTSFEAVEARNNFQNLPEFEFIENDSSESVDS